MMKKFALCFSLVVFIFSLQAFACEEKCTMHGKDTSKTEECPMKGKDILKTEEGTVKGTIVCLLCKLGKGEKCAPAIETEDGKIFELCPDSLKDKKIDAHSEMKVEVSGKISYPKEGNPVIHIKDLKEVK